MAYELEFEDTFDAGELDRTRWLPYYLPHWSSRARSAARYSVGGGVDGETVKRVDQSPAYPMQLMLGIYEFPAAGAERPPESYPKEFVVDYIRGHRLAG